MAPATQEPILVSGPTAARQLGISYASFKRLKRDGVIRPAVNLPGRQPRYNISLLAEQLISQEKSGVSPLRAVRAETIAAKLERQRKLNRLCDILAEQLLKAAQILREEQLRPKMTHDNETDNTLNGESQSPTIRSSTDACIRVDPELQALTDPVADNFATLTNPVLAGDQKDSL